MYDKAEQCMTKQVGTELDWDSVLPATHGSAARKSAQSNFDEREGWRGRKIETRHSTFLRIKLV
jgi:hypothetical protein